MSTERNGQDERDTSPVDAKTDVGPATRHAYAQHGVEAGEFDREINVRSVLWAGAILVVVALVAHLLVWWLLAGFRSLEKKADAPLTPIETASPQQEPPLPRLQTTPEEDLRQLRAQEDALLNRAAWVDRQQGTVRVPIDVAIDVIARRGLRSEVAGNGQEAAQTPDAPKE